MGKNKNQRYAVAGGPSSGKTTLVNELAELGYKVYPVEFFRISGSFPCTA